MPPKNQPPQFEPDDSEQADPVTWDELVDFLSKVVVGRGRWYHTMILTAVLMLVAVVMIIGIILILPEPYRGNGLYRLGLADLTNTPLPPPTITHTPSPVPTTTITPIPSPTSTITPTPRAADPFSASVRGIVLANFTGSNGADVTRQLEQALASRSLSVIRLPQPINGSSSDVDTVRDAYSATLIVWGDTQPDQTQVFFATFNDPTSGRSQQEPQPLSLSRWSTTLTTPDQLNYVADHALGQIQRTQRNYEAALQAFESALSQVAPGTETQLSADGIYFLVGRTYFDLGATDQSLASLNLALVLNPSLAEAYHNRGVIYHQLEDFGAARAEYEQALALKPESATTIANRNLLDASPVGVAAGLPHLQSNDSTLLNAESQLAELTQQLADNPNNAQAYYDRGKVHYALGNTAQALADFTQALDLSPDAAAVYRDRGNLYLALGDYERAFADLQQAVTLSGENIVSVEN